MPSDGRVAGVAMHVLRPPRHEGDDQQTGEAVVDGEACEVTGKRECRAEGHDRWQVSARNTESRVGVAYPASVVGASPAARGGCNTGRRTAG
jgi:hypothetical protein